MRRLMALLAVLAATLVGASAATAASAHPVAATVRSHQVDTANGVILEAGVVRGRLGEGAILIRLRPLPGSRARMTFKTWYEKGTFSGTVTVDLTRGGTRFTGSGRFTGGTGRFAGASGTFTTDATRSSSGLLVQQLTGTLIF
jgi:hypothetical protein